MGVYNILECFKKYSQKNKKSKLVHISTDEVYGDILTGRSDEKYAYKPSSPYAASKASSDHLVYSYVRTHNIYLQWLLIVQIIMGLNNIQKS